MASTVLGGAFDPVQIGLPADFILTDYTRLKGCSCKLPQSKLLSLLESLSSGVDDEHSTTPLMDCSVVPLHHRNERGEPLFLVSTTDFFFPSVEDPYLQGQVGAANVLSDLYSMGITTCDNMLMLLAASTDMDESERMIVTRQILKGFVERTQLGGAPLTGGQTVLNPWPLIGGVAMSVVTESEMIRPFGKMKVGDVLVLTKPLGNQIAVNLKQWASRPSPLYLNKVKGHLTEEEIERLYRAAGASMKRLNRTAAQLMHKYGAHGGTDVTGFGILGHARNLGESQIQVGLQCSLLLHTLPIFRVAVKASRLMDDKFRLFSGLSAETSGGLLIALDSVETAKAFIHEIQHLEEGAPPAWIVGEVVPRDAAVEPSGARLSDQVQFLEVDEQR